ncbi:MAG TPA: fumarate hydratase [bacterium]
MRKIPVSQITEAVRKLCIETNTVLGEDVVIGLQKARQAEKSPLAKDVLERILENAKIAKNECIPLCQDTGFVVVFMEIGQDVCLEGRGLKEAVDEGVRQGYREGFFRGSIVSDPFERKNTGDNVPAVLYTEIVQGDRVRIRLAPKGGGAENMSGIRMLTPSAGVEGVKAFVVEQVSRAGANPCPPVVVGIGIGGTFEKCALLSKKAVLRNLGERHPSAFYADLERDLLERVNRIGIGPAGFGGRTTALDVFIEVHPCHIAALPVAVNLQCHAARHGEIVL